MRHLISIVLLASGLALFSGCGDDGGNNSNRITSRNPTECQRYSNSRDRTDCLNNSYQDRLTDCEDRYYGNQSRIYECQQQAQLNDPLYQNCSNMNYSGYNDCLNNPYLYDNGYNNGSNYNYGNNYGNYNNYGNTCDPVWGCYSGSYGGGAYGYGYLGF